MTRNVRICGLLGVVLIGSAILLFISFHNARKEADELIARIPEEWSRTEGRLQFLTSVTMNHRLAAWEFSYEPANSFVNPPITLQVTLTGQVVASNPRDALSKLRALETKQATEGVK